MCTLKNLLSATLILGLLQGCANDLFPGGRLESPQETISELMVLGASLGPVNTLEGVLPDDIGASVDSERSAYVSAGDLAIKVDPSQLVEQNISSQDFLYAFSRQVGENFEVLVNPRFSTEEPLERMFFELFHFFPDEESSLLGIADFFLDSNVFFVPVSATHLELRVANSGESDPLLVQRWELSSFYGYNRYLKPLIDTNQ